MCGLTGFLTRPGADTHALRAIARDMASRIRHRGPDDSGEWVDAAAGIEQTFDQNLADLVISGRVSFEVALTLATNSLDFELQLRGLRRLGDLADHRHFDHHPEG